MTNKKILSAAICSICAMHVSADEALVLEEIMVTAQKAVETIQGVPVTVNAITGEAFDDSASFGMEDLGRLTAGLNLNSSGNDQNITLRGIGTKISSPQSARTNIYIDGVLAPQQQIAFLSQFDLARFELLRGPQGTLYGKASPTGTIVIHTQNPNLFESEGFAQHSSGQHDLSNTQFGVSIPLIEGELGLRLSGVYDENNSRNITNINRSDPISRTSAGRAVLVWAPDNNFDLRLNYSYIENTSGIDIDVAEAVDGSVSPYDRQSLADQEYKSNIRVSQTIVELNYDLDWAVLSSNSYYTVAKNDSITDQDYTSEDISWLDVDIGFDKLFNTELRLASDGNDFWDWTVGLYYAGLGSKTQITNFNRTLVQNPALPGLWIATDPQVTYIDFDVPASEDFGFFSHNTFFLDDDWTLTLGARWSKEHRFSANTGVSVATIPGFGPPTSTPLTPIVTDSTYIDWTGTAKIAYTISPDEMVYFTVDLGGRGGGSVLDFTATTPSDLLEYDPESNTSFELGYKSDLLGGRLRLNTALYYQIFEDFQVQANGIPIIDDSGTLTTFDVIENAKEVISSGAEIEVTYLVTESWQLNTMVSYNDTKSEDFSGVACNDGSVLDPNMLGSFATCDYSGQRIGGDTGNWSAVAGSNYSLFVDALGAEWYVDALMKFEHFREAPSTKKISPSYTTFDLFTGLRFERFDVKVWVKNVFDKEAITAEDTLETQVADLSRHYTPNTADAFSGNGIIAQRQVINPRQLGLTLRYQF